MPVRKLPTLAAASESLWRRSDDPGLWKQIADLWALSDRLSPPWFLPGVYRHHSIEAANVLVDEWEAERIQRQRKRTGR